MCDCWRYDLVNKKIQRVCKESTKTQIIICDPAKSRVCQKGREIGNNREEVQQENKKKYARAGRSISKISMQNSEVTESNDLLQLRSIVRTAIILNGSRQQTGES